MNPRDYAALMKVADALLDTIERMPAHWLLEQAKERGTGAEKAIAERLWAAQLESAP